MQFRLMILVIQLKKILLQHIEKVNKKIHDHTKDITAQEFNMLTVEYFAERLKQTKLTTKDDITDFVKETYFDEKLRNINTKATSNKAKLKRN